MSGSFWLSMSLLALVGCGTSDGTPDSTTTANLACNAVTYCSTWSAMDTLVSPPQQRGGPIADGIYRRERGTGLIELLQFEGSRVNRIEDGFQNRSGTYTTTNGMIAIAYRDLCDRQSTREDGSTWSMPYLAAGDSLLLGMARDLNGQLVWYEYKRLPPEQICATNANVRCEVSECSCAVAVNGFGTVTSTGCLP